MANITTSKNRTQDIDFSSFLGKEIYFAHYGGAKNLQNKLPTQSTLVGHKTDFGQSVQFAMKADTTVVSPGGMCGLAPISSPIHNAIKPVSKYSEPGFHDEIAIDSIIFHKETNQLEISAVTCLERPSEFIDEKIEVFDADGKSIYCKMLSSENTNFASDSFVFNLDSSIEANQNLTVDYTSFWHDEESGEIKGKKAMASSETHFNLISNTKDIILNAPKYIHNTSPHPIVICYARESRISEAVDYSYPRKVDSQNKQYLSIPFSCEVVFDDISEQFQYVDMDKFLLKVYCDKGASEYVIDGRKIEISKKFIAKDGGFSFTLDDDWQSVAPNSNLDHTAITVVFYVEYKTSLGYKYLQIGSKCQDDFSASTKNMPSLMLIWGCVGRGTPVLMADGSLKNIEDIQISDEVYSTSPDGKNIVYNIFNSTEKEECLKFTTQNGKTITTSTTHPIATLKGILPADKIVAGDYITDKGFNQNQVAKIEVCKTQTVGLALKNITGEIPKNGTTFIADGFIVGDNNMQNNHPSAFKPSGKFSAERAAKLALFKELSHE